MIRFRVGGSRSGDDEPRPITPVEGEPRLPDQVLEHFDFEHDAFKGDPWPEVTPPPEFLPAAVAQAAEEMKSLVDRQAGTRKILMALDDPLLDRKRPADRYVSDRLAEGEAREQIRADVQAAHDALDHKLGNIKLTP